MKKTSIITIALLLGCASSQSQVITDDVAAPETEMRSTWIASVYRLDWPPSVISTTGSASQIKKQKDALITLLDSLQINNFNAAKLQVRARCDAFYKSSYEPWSSDLVSTRGMDPGYDPLEFFVDECHKRGIEAHAWVNPLRYETVIGTYTGTPHAYRDEHPDWLIDVGSTSILNPAIPEVRKRICDIIAEIVTNYDIDGLLFDDYFYLSGTQTSQDYTQYKQYTDAGGKMSQDDWRRENINTMVAEVNRTIKSIKPWVRFGISPAGVTCTDVSVANKHGVPVCGSGSDWQYDDIYSDPLAWLEDKSLDYISPQIYWGIGYSSADFSVIAKWWSDVVPMYKRHMFVSEDITSLTSSSKAPVLRASGPNVSTFDEYRQEIGLTRKYSHDGTPGSVFYRAAFLYSKAPEFSHFLRTNVFSDKALMPVMSWYPAKPLDILDNVTLTGNTLSWKAEEGMRYAVFTVPENNTDDRRVIKVVYGDSYTLDKAEMKTGKPAVAPYDRYANVYSLRTPGTALGSLNAPKIIAPKDGEMYETPFTFRWEGVENAQSYIVEIDDNSDFSSPVATQRVFGATELNSSELNDLPKLSLLYWRVHALADDMRNGISEADSFTAFSVNISSPENGETSVSLTPEIKWNCNDRDVTVQLSDVADFNNIIAEATVKADHWNVPAYTLMSNTAYYVRLSYEHKVVECVSDPVRFMTCHIEPQVPIVKYPVNNGLLHADGSIAIMPAPGARSFRAEVCASDKFLPRQSYVTNNICMPDFTDEKTGAEIKLAGKNLTDGSTYYLRIRATYTMEDGTTENSDFCEPVKFTYTAENAGADDALTDVDGLNVLCDNMTLHISGAAAGSNVQLIMADGRVISENEAGTDGRCMLTAPAHGIYVVTDGRDSVKISL